MKKFIEAVKGLFGKAYQGLLNLHNAWSAARRFRKEFIKILRIEQKSTDKYNHADYDSCEARMRHMVHDAVEPVVKMEALSACIHRSEDHGDDTEAESANLIDSMSEGDVKSVMAWWRG